MCTAIYHRTALPKIHLHWYHIIKCSSLALATMGPGMFLSLFTSSNMPARAFSYYYLTPPPPHTILFRIYDDPFYCVCDVTVVIIFIFKIVASNESGLFFPHLVRYQTLIEAFHVPIPQNSKRFHLAHPIPFLPSYFLLAIR